jgi:hypothetical protein
MNMDAIKKSILQFFQEINAWEIEFDKKFDESYENEVKRQVMKDECIAIYRFIIKKYLYSDACDKAQDVLPGCPSRFDPDRDEIIEPFYQHRGFTAVEFIKRWSGIEQRKRFLLKENDGKWLIYNYQRYNEEKNRWDKDYF